MPLAGNTFQTRLDDVQERIERAAARSGRKRSDVTLVAVTKKFSASIVDCAYAQGLRHFGENYVQEFAAKKPQLGPVPGASFHLIGHLQSNKAALACGLFHIIETVDSSKLLRRLDAAAGEHKLSLEVFLEVKLSEEQSKTGARPEQIPDLLQTGAACSHLRVTGLMTIPPWSTDPELSRPYFKQLASLAREHSLKKLSMGMSNDFEAAIEEGATTIRVGTALFGPRPKPA